MMNSDEIPFDIWTIHVERYRNEKHNEKKRNIEAKPAEKKGVAIRERREKIPYIFMGLSKSIYMIYLLIERCLQVSQ